MWHKICDNVYLNSWNDLSTVEKRHPTLSEKEEKKKGWNKFVVLIEWTLIACGSFQLHTQTQQAPDKCTYNQLMTIKLHE